jgi:hypothetical protein
MCGGDPCCVDVMQIDGRETGYMYTQSGRRARRAASYYPTIPTSVADAEHRTMHRGLPARLPYYPQMLRFRSRPVCHPRSDEDGQTVNSLQRCTDLALHMYITPLSHTPLLRQTPLPCPLNRANPHHPLLLVHPSRDKTLFLVSLGDLHLQVEDPVQHHG